MLYTAVDTQSGMWFRGSCGSFFLHMSTTLDRSQATGMFCPLQTAMIAWYSCFCMWFGKCRSRCVGIPSGPADFFFGARRHFRYSSYVGVDVFHVWCRTCLRISCWLASSSYVGSLAKWFRTCGVPPIGACGVSCAMSPVRHLLTIL